MIREVVSHWQLRHPNVVALLGIHQFDHEENGPPSMVLQYAEHGSAMQYLKANPDPQNFLRVVCVQFHSINPPLTEPAKVKGLLDGICYLHSRTPPVIHGDLHDVRSFLLVKINDSG